MSIDNGKPPGPALYDLNTTARLVRTRTTDGVLLHGLTTDRAAGQAVLAIHGAWGNFYNSPVADLIEPAAARGWMGLSLNTRGHDLGTLGDGEACVGFMRDLFEQAPIDLDAAAGVLRARGAERVLAVAHSYGSHKLTSWVAGGGAPDVRGVALLSPAPALAVGARWFVDGAVEHYIARAAAAVAAGEPHRLIVLSSTAPVPMVAEAATVLSTWSPNTRADSTRYVPEIAVPLLVLVGAREPAGYRQRAEDVAAAAADAELLVLDDDHYYARDRAGMSEAIFDWAVRRHVLSVEPPPKEET